MGAEKPPKVAPMLCTIRGDEGREKVLSCAETATWYCCLDDAIYDIRAITDGETFKTAIITDIWGWDGGRARSIMRLCPAASN